MANENQIKHKIVISGEQEYKRTMREMSASLKEAKSEVKAATAEMDAQGRSYEGLTAQMKALESQRQKEADMLREMQRHLEAVVEATGAESDEAVKLRTRINAMRAEVAQTSGQISRLTGEMEEAREAAEGLGSSGAANGIKGLGAAAESAEGDLDGILGKLTTLGQGFTIGIGASIGQNVLDGVTKAFAEAVVTGWNEAVQDRIDYNQIGVKTGTAGTGQNLFMADMLDQLMLANPNRNASSWIDAIAAAYTQFPESTFRNGERLNEILKQLDAVSFGVGTDLPGTINTIGRLKDVFGENEEELAAIYYWLGTSKAGTDGINTLEKYATTWASIGMNAVGAAGALVLARIAGVDNLDAVGKAAKNAEATLLGDKGTLTKLGLEAADLPKKFKAGGEEAKAAMELLLNTFLGKDEKTQNELGGKIFGQDNWERYGTRIAQAILDGYETELTPGMMEAVVNAEKAMTDDLKSQLAITDELKEQVLGEMFAPWEAVMLEATKMANEKGISARESGKASGVAIIGEWIVGFVEGLEEAQEEHYQELGVLAADAEYGFDADDLWKSWNAGADSLKEPAEEAGEEAADAVLDAYASGFARNPRMRELDQMMLPEIGSAPASAVDEYLDALLGAGGKDAIAAAAQEKGEEDAGTVLDAYGDGMEQGADYQSVKAQVENLNAQIAAALNAGDNDLAADLQEKRNALIPTMMQLAADAKKTGKDAKEGFDDEFKGVTVTVEDTVTGALTVLDGHVSDFYNKGWNAGDAFVRGYKDAQGIQSPSKVMEEAAGYTMQGLFNGLERGVPQLETRAAGLSAILAGGASAAGASAAALTVSGGGGVNAEDLRQALSGMAVVMDGETVGQLTERSVSETGARRAAGTISGRANGVRGW
jgi:hypothetical protein